MGEPQIAYDWEPESVDCLVSLVGTGAAAPTRSANSRANYTISRVSQGVIKIIFSLQDDPGPTCQGLAGFCFGDATATNVLGWSVCGGTYTARSGGTPANYTFTIGNGSNAATDLLTTSTLNVLLSFKQAPGTL